MSQKDLENNKFAAAILIAGIVAMLAAFITNIIYAPNSKYVEQKRGYQIEVAEVTAGGSAKEEEALDIVALMQAADSTAGAKVAKKCVACHNFDKGAPHKVGPNLHNVMGAKIAAADGYVYSDALIAVNKNWNYDEMFAFLKSPKAYAKGTKMSFAGLRKPQDIANMIAYIKSKSDNNYSE